MRSGATFFLEPTEPAQRRYEALRAYVVDHRPAAEVGEAFGYTAATVRQMAADLRAGRASFFASSKPGPKGPRKSGALAARVLELRADGHSVTEIAEALRRDHTPLSPQTVWSMLEAQGMGRLSRRSATQRGAPPRLALPKAARLKAWPAPTTTPCDHAGLYLLLPAMADLGVDRLVAAAGYPGTSQLSSWHSMASLLLHKLARTPRHAHTTLLADDPGLGLAAGLTALPKATHLGTYSHRVRREANEALLAGLARRLIELGLATGEDGFNLDFHAIRHHGQDAPLERHYVPKRSQRTRSVLCFFAQDHAAGEMVYANADITKAEQAREVVAFADYWQRVAGTDPGLLVFDSKLTTYPVLDELSGRHIRWLTLRQRGAKELERLNALPASAWTTLHLNRSGRYRRPQIYEEVITLKGIDTRVRQIAVRNIGRDEPTLLITNDLTTPAKLLFGRYAERMLIENELDAYIGGFHLDALSSGLPLNVDVDTTLTVVAGNIYRLFARGLPRYETATPDRIWRHFLDTTGTIHVHDDNVNVQLNIRTYTPVLIDAGYAELDAPIPWWDRRTLRFSFPPR
jgi:hypothetical protein